MPRHRRPYLGSGDRLRRATCGKKGVRDMLEAVALISPDLRGTPLVIAGYGPAESN